MIQYLDTFFCAIERGFKLSEKKPKCMKAFFLDQDILYKNKGVLSFFLCVALKGYQVLLSILVIN